MTIVEGVLLGCTALFAGWALFVTWRAQKAERQYRQLFAKHTEQLHSLNDTWGKSAQDMLATQIGIMEILNKAVTK